MADLDDIRVVDFSSEIAGPYVTKLFADAGADVIKVEPPEGDPLRRRAVHGETLDERDAALFRYLNAGKRSVIGAPGDPEIMALIESADLVVDSGAPTLDVGSLRERLPHLVVLTLSPFGRSGPFAGRPATTFTVEAESGTMALHGLKGGVPFQTGGRLFDWIHGVFASVGAMAALLRAARDGVGEHVDATMLAATSYAGSAFFFTGTHALDGRPELKEPAAFVELPSIEPTSNGWVGVMTGTHQQFESFVTAIGHPELLEGDWPNHEYRFTHIDEWNAFVRPWMRERTTEEIIELLTLLRVPNAQVSNGKTVLEHEQFVARDIFMRSPDGDFMQPKPTGLIDGERPEVRGPAPALGEHTGKIEARPARTARTARGSGAPDLPFKGMRVIDATAFWAGPAVGYIFASLGADVIHLESIQRPDGMRMWVNRQQAAQPRWWERGYLMLANNTNKRDLTLDLSTPRGKELMDRLIESSDLLIENFSPRVFDNLGLTRERVREVNPKLVFVRMPAFGLDGPWRDNVGFAQTMEQVCGIAWLTGHLDDQPRIPRGPCDPTGGYHACFAAMKALYQREKTGKGAFIESVFVESILNCTAESLIQYSAYGQLLERQGNHSDEAAPQGLYRCAGWERWLALSVTSDQQWQQLKAIIGNPDWAQASQLESHDGRREAQEQLDRELAAWTADKDVDKLVAQLTAGGIPAGSLADPRLLPEHPQLAALGLFEEVSHPVVGSYPVPGMPFRYASVGNWVNRCAPTLGQHNEEILRDVLGLTDGEIASLAEEQIIGTQPSGA